jgi:bacterial/archaeal transporter family-2 protein
VSAITYAVWAFTAGALIPLMAILNGGLARATGGAIQGGVIVGFYILSITFIAPRFGVGNAILFAVTVQLLTSALIDHFALAAATLRPLTAMRAMGLLIVVVGVVITQVGDRVDPSIR